MVATYRKSIGNASNCKDGAAPNRVQVSGDTRPNPRRGGKRLLDEFRDRMGSLHYAFATEKFYRHWMNQAFSAILFLYKQVLKIELPKTDALRAKASRRLPVVLSQNEVARLIAHVDGGAARRDNTSVPCWGAQGGRLSVSSLPSVKSPNKGNGTSNER
jgi:hypothetical protein